MYSRLIIEMKKRGITQTKLAEALGISTRTVSTKVSGGADFNTTEMYAICEMIPDVPMDELFVREGR